MPGCQSGALGHPTTGAAAAHRDAEQVAPARFVAVEETQFQNAWKPHEKVSSQLWFWDARGVPILQTPECERCLIDTFVFISERAFVFISERALSITDW